MHHDPLNQEESFQSVNPDFFDFSKGAEGVIKANDSMRKEPCLVKLCFVAVSVHPVLLHDEIHANLRCRLRDVVMSQKPGVQAMPFSHDMRLPDPTAQCGTSSKPWCLSWICHPRERPCFVSSLSLRGDFRVHSAILCAEPALAESEHLFVRGDDLVQSQRLYLLSNPRLPSAGEQACIHDLGKGKALLMMDRLALQLLATLVCVEAPIWQLAQSNLTAKSADVGLSGCLPPSCPRHTWRHGARTNGQKTCDLFTLPWAWLVAQHTKFTRKNLSYTCRFRWSTQGSATYFVFGHVCRNKQTERMWAVCAPSRVICWCGMCSCVVVVCGGRFCGVCCCMFDMWTLLVHHALYSRPGLGWDHSLVSRARICDWTSKALLLPWNKRNTKNQKTASANDCPNVLDKCGSRMKIKGPNFSLLKKPFNCSSRVSFSRSLASFQNSPVFRREIDWNLPCRRNTKKQHLQKSDQNLAKNKGEN